MFLLNICLVVLHIRTLSGGQNRFALARSHPVLVDAFPATICTQSQNQEGKEGTSVLKRSQHQITTAPHDWEVCCPARGDIGQGEGIEKGSFQSLAVWATKSPSRKPDLASVHGKDDRMGICCLSGVPAQVVANPCPPLVRAVHRRRSAGEALSVSRGARHAEVSWICPCRSSASIFSLLRRF